MYLIKYTLYIYMQAAKSQAGQSQLRGDTEKADSYSTSNKKPSDQCQPTKEVHKNVPKDQLCCSEICLYF